MGDIIALVQHDKEAAFLLIALLCAGALFLAAGGSALLGRLTHKPRVERIPPPPLDMVRLNKHFDVGHTTANFVMVLQSEMRQVRKDLEDLEDRVDKGESQTQEFREQFFKLEGSLEGMLREVRVVTDPIRRQELLMLQSGGRKVE